ncbi:MAG TPA: hypothetical protein DD733_06730, partial [Clostridiales bacterium]|nr:hypothetical protein [Clostridiales bacterium]
SETIVSPGAGTYGVVIKKSIFALPTTRILFIDIFVTRIYPSSSLGSKFLFKSCFMAIIFNKISDIYTIIYYTTF